MHVRAAALFLSMVLSFLMAGTATARGGAPRVRAEIDGRPIGVTEIGAHFCHDFAFPVVHCYLTASELEVAVGLSAAAVIAAYGPNDYLTIYSEPTYGGAYMHVSQNYDTLFWIGWNDRISSYKVRNGARGTFWSDWRATGRGTDFCCSQTVPYLPAAVDNTFTSVYRR